jgi:outer membrane protein insertion porin family
MTGFTLLLALILNVAEPQTLQTQPQDPNRIADIEFIGNRLVQTDTIRYNLQTKIGDPVRQEVIRRDIKQLYTMGTFADIRVEERQTDEGKILTFIFQEKRRIRLLEYVGNKSITQSEILEKLRDQKVGLSVESYYDETRVKQAITVIRNLLAEKGRQQAKVDVMVENMPPNAVAVTFNIEEGPKVKIEDIDIQGNEVFSDRKVKRAMKLVKEAGGIAGITGKDTYHELKLADDITRIRMLYGENGYVRANVLEPVIETRPTKVFRTLPFIKPTFPWGIPIPFFRRTENRTYVTIRIEENEQYRVGDVRVTGSTNEFPAEVVTAVLGLNQGQIFNETALREGFENLKKLYGTRGYINFTAVPIQDFDEEKKIVNLTINIDEDRKFVVNRIGFLGNTTTRDKVIRREVLITEGYTFSSQFWDMSIQRLNQLGYFEEIKPEDAEVKPHPTEPEVDVTLKVQEKQRNQIGFNGGVSGIGGSFLGLSYQTNNFLGFGETLSVNLQGGTRQSQYQFSFTEPYLFDRPISSGFSVFSTNFRYDQARELFGLNPEDLAGVTGFDQRLNFEQRRVGFNIYASYPFQLWNRIGLTYGWDNSRTEAVNPATSEYFSAVATQERDNFVTGSGSSFSDFNSRRLIPSYSYNATNGDPMAPFSGQSLTATMEFTGGFLGGNVNYYRPSVDYRFFVPMNRRRNTLAFRFLGSFVTGFSNTAVPFYERFFLGGDYDIRGFDFRAISPIAVVKRFVDVLDPETGLNIKRPFDDIVYVGGDTQGVMNLEYRIPVVGPITLAPFLDVGNSWVARKNQLRREIIDSDGRVTIENVRFLPGTNSGFRASTGLEVQVVMPVINAPFRLIFAFNPSRISRTYIGDTTGLPFFISEPKRDLKFTVGRTF